MKLTDAEIIKAMECCKGWESCPDECPFYSTDFKHSCIDDDGIMVQTYDLLVRQRNEIERLQRHNKEYGFCNLLGNCLVYSKNLEDYNNMRKSLKSEAIKEFAERLKGHTTKAVFGQGKYSYSIVTEQSIDNLVKELTEQ